MYRSKSYQRLQAGFCARAETAAYLFPGGWYVTRDFVSVDGLVVAEMEDVGSWAHEVGARAQSQEALGFLQEDILLKIPKNQAMAILARLWIDT